MNDLTYMESDADANDTEKEDAQMTDEEIIRLLKYDFSEGKEETKERILRQCLAIITEEDQRHETQNESTEGIRDGSQ